VAKAPSNSKTSTPGAKPAPKKSRETSSDISTIAADVLAKRIKPTANQIMALAASALGQDQTKGQQPKTKTKTKK
jgi:hypothetical protein